MSNHVGESENAKGLRDRLLAENNLTMSAIIDAPKDTGIADDTIRCTTTRSTPKFRTIMTILQHAYFVNVCYGRIWDSDTNRRILRIRLIGTKSDIEIAQYVFALLTKELERVWGLAKRENPDIARDSSSFYYHLGEELCNILDLAKCTNEATWGLMVIDNKLARSNYTQNKFKVKSQKLRINESYLGYTMGKKYAHEVKLTAGIKSSPSPLTIS